MLNIKKIFFTILLLFVATLTTVAQTKKFHGVSFNTELKLDGENLVINGAGLREKYFMDLYVAGLYVPKKTADSKKIIYDDTEMAIHLKIISNSVTRERFIESVNEGFAISKHGSASKEEIKKFVGFFSEPIQNGDKIYLDYIPGKGVRVTKNGEVKGTIPGLEFKKALFGIWFGTPPVQESLKNEMLGKD
ncbi:MAG: chalcone isomerase [Sphingomonadales bacterium]|nr:chalcone isomerase [Sphingomonadales bacterium]